MAPAQTTGTPGEQRPNDSVDWASMHVAIYDTMMAISGTYKPFAVTPTSPNAGGAG